MKALEFPLSNDFFCVAKLDSTRDNTSHGRKGGFVTVTVYKSVQNSSGLKLAKLC